MTATRLLPGRCSPLLLGLLLLLAGCGRETGDLKSLRGREAYYQGGLEEHAEEVTTRLLDTAYKITLKAKVLVRYQCGLDHPSGAPFLEQGAARFKDALILYFSGFSRNQLLGTAVRPQLRREVAALFEKKVFPGEEARVRQVLFPVWQFSRLLN